MFKPNGFYSGLKGVEQFFTCPFGTFRSLTVENIAITVDEGAKEPTCIIFPQPESSFGEITVTNVTLNGKSIKP